MNRTSHRICIWGGPVAAILFFLGLWPLANFVPLLDPMASAEEIAHIYQSNTIGIRLGGISIMFSGPVWGLFFAVIYGYMKRIEGEHAPFAVAQAITGAGVAVLTFLPGLLFAITAFRPERPPEFTLLLNDFSFLLFVVPTPPALIQILLIGLAVMRDTNEPPVLPRWLGYFNVWCAVLLIPGVMAVMFKSGPFAWKGIIAFWLPAFVLTIWIFTMTYYMLKGLEKE